MTPPVILALTLALVCLPLSGCESEAESHSESHAAGGEVRDGKTGEEHSEAHGAAHAGGAGAGKGEHHTHKIVVTSPVRQSVINTQQYVCQIHSCQHIEVRALEGGYLQEIHVREGQAVKKGELMFKIIPILYQARLDSEVAEANRAQIELKNAESLAEKGIVSAPEIALKKAEVAKAQAKVELAKAELSFTDVKAPFDGIMDRQRSQLGSLIEEGDVLTTLSDNSLMWVYFNVPEARYLEYKAELDRADREDADEADLHIELKLANGEIFQQPGKIGAIEADFNNTTGNIAFRADFPNPEGLLRNGQTGTVLIHREMKNSLVIPQRATFEILAKRYAFVVGEDRVVRQRDIEIQLEQEDIFTLKRGLDENDKIILEGIREVRDGDKVEYEFRDAAKVLEDLKYHAE